MRFRISDVHMPESAEILVRLHGNDLLEGHVTAFTDAGRRHGAFAVIEVAEFEQPMIVPTESLQPGM